MKTELEKNVVLEKIKEDLQQFTSEKMLRCPTCDEIIEWDDADYNPAGNEYTCPKCRATHSEIEFEVVNMLDYIEEVYLNYLTNKNKNTGEDYE